MNDVITVIASSNWNIVAFEVFIIAAVAVAFGSGNFAIGLLALAMQAGFQTVFAMIRERMK
jgi:hypothetical protein